MPQVFPAIVRYFVMVLGNTFDSHKTFMDHLTISPNLYEVSSVNEGDVIIVFVPIVSRAGTDIAAAKEKIPQDKSAVFVVLHHTFDQDYIAPDSRFFITNNKEFAIDCLFHEDQGLLKCPRNDDAIRAVKKHLNIEEHVKVDRRWIPLHKSKIVIFLMASILVICISEGGILGGILGGIVIVILIFIWVKLF